MKKLAIISTHPIQYNAPLFRRLTERGAVAVKVFYTWGAAVLENKYDPGFGKTIEWDIPLTEGYEYDFVENIATNPGSHHFKGIDNPGLIAAITEWQAEAVLVFGWSFKSHLKALRYFKGKIPVLFRGDSTLLDEAPGIKTLLRRIFLRWVYSHIDVALYVGNNNKAYFLKHGLSEKQLIRAPHAIDNDRFATAIKNNSNGRQEWRSKEGIQPEDFVVLFSGKLEEKKNPQFIITLSRLLSENKNITFLLVGNGVLEDSLKTTAAGDPRILFAGFRNQSEMPMVYRATDVYILPSRGPGETWGLAINEAMAVGLPVMASTKCGGAIDLIDDNKNGLTFAPDEVEKAATFIRKLISDRDYCKKAGALSQEKIRSFSFDNICEAIEKSLLH